MRENCESEPFGKIKSENPPVMSCHFLITEVVWAEKLYEENSNFFFITFFFSGALALSISGVGKAIAHSTHSGGQALSERERNTAHHSLDAEK